MRRRSKRSSIARVASVACSMVILLAVQTIAWARPDDNADDLFHYDEDDTVESFDSPGGNFRVFFTRAGTNAVPATDNDASGVPDSVEFVANLYESVHEFYMGLGFRSPKSDAALTHNGGDARFDVYLLDFGGQADGAFRRHGCDAASICSGYMISENDYAGYGYPSIEIAHTILASHEYFHAVQAAYDADESSIVSEGTAVWATERYDATLHDLEAFSGGYLGRPDRSLFQPGAGPVDSFGYGAGVFFQFLQEEFGDAVVPELWEASVGETTWDQALPTVLHMFDTDFATEFFDFAQWNLYTSGRANPALSYAHGADYAALAVTGESLPFFDDALRMFSASTRYWEVAFEGRSAVDGLLVLPQAVDGSPLRFAAVTRKGNVVSAPIVAETATTRLKVPAGTQQTVTFFVVNTALSGESLRPAMCLGDAAEVDACLHALGTATPPDSDTPGDTSDEDDGGCSIAAGPPHPGRNPLAWFISAALVLGATGATGATRRRKKP